MKTPAQHWSDFDCTEKISVVQNVLWLVAYGSDKISYLHRRGFNVNQEIFFKLSRNLDPLNKTTNHLKHNFANTSDTIRVMITVMIISGSIMMIIIKLMTCMH